MLKHITLYFNMDYTVICALTIIILSWFRNVSRIDLEMSVNLLHIDVMYLLEFLLFIK